MRKQKFTGGMLGAGLKALNTLTALTVSSALTLATLAGCQQTQVVMDARGEPQEVAMTDRSDPRTRARARTDLSAAYYESGNFAVAIEEIRSALDADPSYAPAHNMNGLIQLAIKDNIAAEASFRRALQLAPQDPDVQHNYGWFLCQTGREQSAVEYFVRAAEHPLYQSRLKSYTTAGNCLLQSRRDNEAMDYFNRAVLLEPLYVPAVMPLARLHYQRGALDPARGLVGRVMSGTSQPSVDLLWLARQIECKRGDSQSAQSLALQLRRRFPNSREVEELDKGQCE